jgi:hypothetical protein
MQKLKPQATHHRKLFSVLRKFRPFIVDTVQMTDLLEAANKALVAGIYTAHLIKQLGCRSRYTSQSCFTNNNQFVYMMGD